MIIEMLKLRGDCCIGEKKYLEAIDLYTRALDANEPFTFKILTNRSVAYNLLQVFSEALQDANASLCLEPSRARAYLQKCTAFTGLKRYEDAMTAAQKGYKVLVSLSGDEKRIAEKCVDRWIEGAMGMLGSQDTSTLLLREALAFEQDKFICISKACGMALSCFALSKKRGTTCDLSIASDFELLRSFVFPCLTLAELASFLGLPSQELSSCLGIPLHELLPTDLITDLLSQHLLNLDLLALGFLALDHLFIDLDHILEAFGYEGACRSEVLRCAKSWVSLLRRCIVMTMSSRVPECISDELLSASNELCQHLNAVNDTLHPVIQPLLSLAMLVVFGQCCSLNVSNKCLHACQLFCQSCLVFFEETFFLRDFKELKVLIHVQCLSAWKDFEDYYTEAESKFVEKIVKATEECIEQCPQSYIKKDASSVVGAVKNDQQLRRSLLLAEDLVENIGKIHCICCFP